MVQLSSTTSATVISQRNCALSSSGPTRSRLTLSRALPMLDPSRLGTTAPSRDQVSAGRKFPASRTSHDIVVGSPDISSWSPLQCGVPVTYTTSVNQSIPSPPPWAPKRLPPQSRRQRSSNFPRPTRSHAHRCSRLTRQHGGEQSSLVTLTFDLLTLKVVSESRVM